MDPDNQNAEPNPVPANGLASLVQNVDLIRLPDGSWVPVEPAEGQGE